MYLTDVWVGTTVTSIVVGFFMGRHDGLRIYESQFPPIAWNSPPPTEEQRAERKKAALSFREIWLPHWAWWVFSGQILYWSITGVYTLRDLDLGAPFAWAAAHWWLGVVGLMIAATLGVAWYFWTRKPAQPDEALEQEYAPVIPVRHVPYVEEAPTQQLAPVQPEMWSAPKVEGNWDPTRPA